MRCTGWEFLCVSFPPVSLALFAFLAHAFAETLLKLPDLVIVLLDEKPEQEASPISASQERLGGDAVYVATALR